MHRVPCGASPQPIHVGLGGVGGFVRVREETDHTRPSVSHTNIRIQTHTNTHNNRILIHARARASAVFTRSSAHARLAARALWALSKYSKIYLSSSHRLVNQNADTRRRLFTHRHVAQSSGHAHHAHVNILLWIHKSPSSSSSHISTRSRSPDTRV